MQLKVEEVGERKQTAKGDIYYPFKSDGKTYNVIGLSPPLAGQLLECDVRESSYVRYGRQAISRWATIVKVVPPPLHKITGSLGIGQAVAWFDYCKLAELAHGMASVFEPDDATARAAIVNTALIAFANGKIALPEQDDVPPPDDSDEPPYPEELK